MHRKGFVALVALGLFTCAPPRQAAPEPALHAIVVVEPPPLPRVEAAVLVVLDGVRWQDVEDKTSLPNLNALATSDGASIPSIDASGPNFVSLPGYTEIFTGRASGCRDNDCPPIRERTIVDELADRGDGVAVFASWERLANAAAVDRGRIAISTGRTRAHGVDDELLAPGRGVSPWPGDGEFRPDRFTARAALAHLERRRPTLLFVGLGEPDEYAHHGDREGYLASLRACDATLGELRATLGRMGDRGAKTTIVVTTDHGRAARFTTHGGDWPESGRVWLVAGGAGVVARGTAIGRHKRALADVAPTLRVLLGLPSRPGGEPLDELFRAL